MSKEIKLRLFTLFYLFMWALAIVSAIFGYPLLLGFMASLVILSSMVFTAVFGSILVGIFQDDELYPIFYKAVGDIAANVEARKTGK